MSFLTVFRATAIAQGALLGLLDKRMVKERKLRRSYGISWEIEASDVPRMLHRNVRIEKDGFDNVRRLRDVTKFLLRRVRLLLQEVTTTGSTSDHQC
jgi:hypothetical protein